jgi:CRISPR-associated protein Csm5
MTVYEVILRTLTPLHIGDGSELRRDFDFTVKNARTYRLNEDAILDAKDETQWLNARGAYKLPAELLGEADFQNTAFFRYIIPGVPRSNKPDARVKSHLKDMRDRPYIPGSSLKGALRTALAWVGWNEVKPELNRQAIGRSRSWAAQPLEKKLFGRDPNHDLLRALHVSDLQMTNASEPGKSLLLVNVQVLTKRSAGSPIELEALKSDIELRGTLTIDETLFGAAAERELHFANRRHWLDELMARVQRHSQARLIRLAEWFEKADGCEGIANFYRQLANAKAGAQAAVLQIGWGAGWDGKTLWTHLQQDPRLFEQLVSDFRMHKAAKGSPPRKAGDPFPRSKRVVIDKTNKPAAPLGWVLVDLKPLRPNTG